VLIVIFFQSVWERGSMERGRCLLCTGFQRTRGRRRLGLMRDTLIVAVGNHTLIVA